MIILEKKDTSAILGLKTILDIEKIPYLLSEEEISGQKSINGFIRLYVNYQGSRYDHRLPTIFIGQLNPKLTYEFFGVSDIEILERPFVEIKISRNFLSKTSASIFLKYYRNDSIRLPCFRICFLRSKADFNNIQVLALFGDTKTPAIIKRDNIIWCLFDIGEAFCNLINERYLFNAGLKNNKVGLGSFVFLQKVYYASPNIVRELAHRIIFAYLNKKLKNEKRNEFRTNFPIDLSGWALIQFLRAMILKLNGKIIDIAKLPKGYKSCFVFTHDIEPTEFAYTRGLRALLNYLERDKNAHVIDLVATWARRYCGDLKPALKEHEINCHGLYHQARALFLPYKKLYRNVKQAKDILEDLLDIDILGYRSPRLDRSPELLKALEIAGYRYSSVSVDIERENIYFFGGGISLSYPYRPLLEENNGFRSANFLEFPVTAPDCINPLFMGYSEEEMFQMYVKKINYITDIEGIFMCINHAGVFNARDIQIRMRLLDFLYSLLKDKEYIWQANLGELYKWWTKRERMRFSYGGSSITIRNDNAEPMDGLRINVETEINKKDLIISAIGPGESMKLKI